MFNFNICFLKNGIKAALVQGLLAQNVKENQKNYDITKKNNIKQADYFPVWDSIKNLQTLTMACSHYK